MVPATRTLSTADERREAILEAAMPVFAARGFHGTPTAELAKAAGISHAYLFRLFPTKTDIAIAVTERCHERICSAFAAAAEKAKAEGEDPLKAMGHAYAELIADKDLLMIQLHSHAAAAGDERLRETAAAGYARIVDLVVERTGADPLDVARFFAKGMLMNVMAALGAVDSEADWAVTLRTTPDDETL